ncbi:hypothetical protein MRY82_03455 [bacterium]|nr:hypothetical protein [bacterium]
MSIKKRIGMLALAIILSTSLYNCEILNENPSPFGLLTRSGIVEADLTDTEDLGNGQTQITDTWTNTQIDQSSAVIAFVLDGSGSFDEERETLVSEGIPKVVEYFDSQDTDVCFMVLGGYVDDQNNPNFVIPANQSRVQLANGLILDNPAGVPVSSDNSMDNKCVCTNEYTSVTALKNQVKANAEQLGTQVTGNGEALIESAAALLAKPEILSPLMNAGECMQPEQQIYFVLAGDETSPVMGPKDIPQDINNDGHNELFTSDDPLYSGFNVHTEASGDTRAAMTYADWNSVNNKWNVTRTFDQHENFFRNFFGALPGGFISVGFKDEVARQGESGHTTVAFAEMEMVQRFHSNLEEFQVPIEHLLNNNIPEFVNEFDALAQSLSTVAQYQQTFDTQARCTGSLQVSGDGQVIDPGNIVEVSNTRFTIMSPFNQVTNVQAVYILDEGNCV